MRALIADIDDTICPSTKPVHPDMAKEIDRIVAAGRIFAFISGSTLDQLFGQLAPYLSQPFHILAASGTHYATVHYHQGKPVREEKYREGFSDAERTEIMEAFEALIARYAIQSLTTKDDQLQDRGSQITLSAVGRHAPEEAKRSLDPDGAKRKEWVAFLRTRLGDKYSMRIGGTSSIDITPLGIDKAWGIRRFLELNGLQPSEALFFGDKLGPEGNDYPALKMVDCLWVRDEKHTLEILKIFLPSHKA
jgi:HAD superfamily hydrolase (TIGR01484 family)